MFRVSTIKQSKRKGKPAMTDDTLNHTPKKPDLDWSQIRETVLMLNLAVAQLEKTMKEGNESVNDLTDTFASLIGGMQAIGMATENLPESTEKKTIKANIEPATAKINTAIVAFQFYDKLSQRLAHVSNSLAALGNLIEEPTRLYNPYEWHGLQAMIKSKYTIKNDRIMFDAILNGSTVEEAQQLCVDEDNEKDDDIELF